MDENEAQSARKLILPVTTILFGSFGYGWNVGVMNNAKVAIQNCPEEPHHLEATTGLKSCVAMSDVMWGVVVSAFCIGGLAGGIIGAQMADRYGRRGTSKIIACVFTIAGCVLMISNNITFLVIGRLIVGFACGASTAVVPLYLGEIAPASRRGGIGTLNQMVINVGILASQLAGIALAKTFLWRLLLFMTAAVSIFQLALLYLIPESPRYLVMKGKENQARSSLQQLRDFSTAEIELYELVEGISETSKETQHSIWSLVFNARYGLKVLVLIACILHISQQFSGINVVFYYSTPIFIKVFNSESIAQLLSLTLSGINIVAVMVATYLIDGLGRKPLLLWSSSSMTLSSVLIVIAFCTHADKFSALFLVFFVVSFAIGLGPIPWLLLAELFPTNAVASAASIACASNWASNFVVGLIYLPLAELLGNLSFLPFAIFLGLFTLFTFKFFPETKGKSSDLIMAEFT